jgi:hypothetical protein
MKTRLLSLAALVAFLFPQTALSQIPNAGFETWSAGEPTGWVTSNGSPVYINVTQSTTAHSGSSAIKGECVNVFSVIMAGAIQSGPGGHGFAFTERPASVTGWYQFSASGNDRFGVNVILFKGGESGTMVAIAAIADPTLHASYTKFDAPFVYQTADVPDLCIMQFSVALPFQGSTTHAGSYFLIDDLAFSGTNDIASSPLLPASFQLAQHYPNPFNPSTTIRYALPVSGLVTIELYDLLGRLVATIVNEVKSAGTYEVRFDAAGLSSGTYVYRMRSGAFVQTRKMAFVR